MAIPTGPRQSIPFSTPGFLQPKTFEAIDQIPKTFDEVFNRFAQAKALEKAEKQKKKDRQRANALSAIQRPLQHQLGQLPIEQQEQFLQQARQPRQMEPFAGDEEFQDDRMVPAEEPGIVPQLRSHFERSRRSQEIGSESRDLALKKEKLGLQKAQFDLLASFEKSQSGGLTPKEKFDLEDKIGKRFETLSKDYFKQRDAAARVEASANKPSAAGDLALIFNYMKILDPGSVVRESEFANAAATGSFGERLKAAGQRLLEGERLSPVMRKDFLTRARALFNEAVKIHDNRKIKFRGLAESMDIRPDSVVLEAKSIPDEPDYEAEARKRGLID